MGYPTYEGLLSALNVLVWLEILQGEPQTHEDQPDPHDHGQKYREDQDEDPQYQQYHS